MKFEAAVTEDSLNTGMCRYIRQRLHISKQKVVNWQYISFASFTSK